MLLLLLLRSPLLLLLLLLFLALLLRLLLLALLLPAVALALCFAAIAAESDLIPAVFPLGSLHNNLLAVLAHLPSLPHALVENTVAVAEHKAGTWRNRAGRRRA